MSDWKEGLAELAALMVTDESVTSGNVFVSAPLTSNTVGNAVPHAVLDSRFAALRGERPPYYLDTSLEAIIEVAAECGALYEVTNALFNAYDIHILKPRSRGWRVTPREAAALALIAAVEGEQ